MLKWLYATWLVLSIKSVIFINKLINLQADSSYYGIFLWKILLLTNYFFDILKCLKLENYVQRWILLEFILRGIHKSPIFTIDDICLQGVSDPKLFHSSATCVNDYTTTV